MSARNPTAPPVLALWSAPRSRSTAFLRMMRERGDHTVLHEPFSHVVNFGRTEVDGRPVHGETELIAAIRALGHREPVFFKDTTDYHYPGLLGHAEFLREARHTFIIREPAEVIASHFALNRDLGLAEIGIERLHEIYQAVHAATGERPVVVTAEDLIARPRQTVRAYCSAVGIPFRAEAMTWQPAVLPEWRSTLRWHGATSRTSGFTELASTYPDTVHNNPVLAGYLEHHLPYYTDLLRYRLLVPA
ncbi:sulfotransferase family protein [Actinosynnema sp. NPDC047251]|uniref:Sulfotransferase family protein n=1 Tax=Saccharothrix espanaensis (strain ATCC 51144 / DSM 44229 / JCM 9112 / NBRC 15066 / NRRL 15764) TaxID=1179773 RepID=K0K8F2_SACES|nr:sulfotransferase family protein [Saccharothrix espanaensis]CCH32943.1 hypothetical protein BN6_56840 [Saccharothrix espanaensis DSM 44229]